MTNNKFKIKTGFRLLFLIAAASISIIFSNIIVHRSFLSEFRVQKKSFSIYHPSINKLYKLNELNIHSISLIRNWIFVDKDTGTVQKKELIELWEVDYPELTNKLAVNMKEWDIKEQNKYLDIISEIYNLRNMQDKIMDKLYYFEDYKNAQTMFEIIPLISEDGELITKSREISDKIKILREEFEKKIEDKVSANEDRLQEIKVYLMWLTVIIIGVLLSLGVFIIRNILYITSNLNEVVRKVSKGLLPEVKKTKRKDEIGDFNNNIANMINHLKSISSFATDIGENKFDTDFTPASKGDVLGNALLQMRKNLLTAQKEADHRQEENTQRNWASQGIAVFNKVIRDDNNNLEELADAVIKELVNYTEANVGGLFIVNDENKFKESFLELKSFYAYDRHKYIQKFVKAGETLVGQCYVENDTILVSDVPDDYISITSGLGTDKPRNILIVPLQFNEVTYGVVEIASFTEFAPYKIDFVEKISETIASAISTAKINTRTSRLLAESNEKSKRLEQQEIEARENISKVKEQLEILEQKYKISLDSNEYLSDEKDVVINELEDLKEKSKAEILKEKDRYIVLQSAINKTIPYYEMNTNGDILYANNLYANLLNLPKSEILDHRHINFVSRDFINTGNYKQIWDELKLLKDVNTSIQYMIDGKNKFITENIIPIVNQNDRLDKIIVFCSV